MFPVPGDGLLESLSLFVLLAGTGFAFLVVKREGGRLLEPLRDRFVLGVPWGTLIVIAAVWLFFRFVQGGFEPGGPVVVGFRSWSFSYPQGILFSSFAHASESHLIGNLLGALVFGSVAEYAWSHYPKKRGSQTFSSWLTNPYVRVLCFVLAVLVAGVLASMFVPVAAVGFSSVVFALAGVGVVTLPIATVGAILGLQVLRLVRRAYLSPAPTVQAEPAFFTPSWVDTAIQGHLFGFLLGVLVGVALVWHRDRLPPLRYVVFAALVFLVSRSMEAFYWELGSDRYVLYRGIGTAFVFALATLVGLAVTARNRQFVPRSSVTFRKAAVGLLLVSICAIGVAGVAFNLVSVTPGEETEGGIEVRDYTVNYAENVEDKYVSGAPLPAPLSPPSITTSGVIVTSEKRDAWVRVSSQGRFAAEGRSIVVLGDATWREVVVVSRTAWRFIDGNQTYKVFGNRLGEPATQLFTAEPANTSVILNGSRIQITPAEQFYNISVERDGQRLGSERIPADNETIEIADITFEREGNILTARHERTEIELARYRVGGELDN